MTAFSIHWDEVRQHFNTIDSSLFALWAGPVKPDTCFENAGFAAFQENDDDSEWNAAADRLFGDVLSALRKFGDPRVIAGANRAWVPWYDRLLGNEKFLTWQEQILFPMEDDDWPDCRVEFGNRGVTLRTGEGHFLFWLTMRSADFDALLCKVARGASASQTSLRWEHLLPFDWR
jgi:hypothetical protein